MKNLLNPKRLIFHKNNHLIDVDRVRAFEAHDSQFYLQSIDLQPDQISKDIKQKRSFTSIKAKQQPLNSKKTIETGKLIPTIDPQKLNIQNDQIERTQPLYSYQNLLHKYINHFLSIKQVNPSNKITSEQFYNIFQTRKSIQSKSNQKTLLTKFLFEIQYTNYLSYLIWVIEKKQKIFGVYSESQELEKILYLVEAQIQAMTQLYLNAEKDKIFELYSTDFINDIKDIDEIQSQTKDIDEEQILSFASSSQHEIKSINLENHLQIHPALPTSEKQIIQKHLQDMNSLHEVQKNNSQDEEFKNYQLTNGDKRIQFRQLENIYKQYDLQEDIFLNQLFLSVEGNLPIDQILKPNDQKQMNESKIVQKFEIEEIIEEKFETENLFNQDWQNKKFQSRFSDQNKL